MGEMLMQTERAKPGPDKKDRSHNVTAPPTLADLERSWGASHPCTDLVGTAPGAGLPPTR